MSSSNPSRQLLEAVAALQMPSAVNQRMQHLMDRNTDGGLDCEGRAELEALVEFSESIGLLRARALKLLGMKPT